MSETIYLVESRATTIAITASQAAELIEVGKELKGREIYWGHKKVDEDDLDDDDVDGRSEINTTRNVVSCTMVGEGSYSVSIRNAVGAIRLKGVSIFIQPKIGLKHFSHLAKKSYVTPRIGVDALSVSEEMDTFWEIVANWCVVTVEDLVRRGLLADYREKQENLKFVRGRVNIMSTSRMFLSGRLELDCMFDELDIDHPLNRVLRAAVRVIAGSPLIHDPELKKRASRLDRMMAGISDLKQGDLGTHVDRRTSQYATAIDLCQRILAGVGVAVNSGAKSARTFLVPTPGLIENAILTLLASALIGVDVDKRTKQMAGDVYFSLNPDLVFNSGSVVGDVKYKMAKPKWNRSEVEQASMFATGFDASAAVIITFGKSEAVTDIGMQLGKLPIRRIVWSVGREIDPLEMERSVIDRVREFIAPFLMLHAVA